MKRRILLNTILSIAVGTVGHLVFYPIIESWNNHRMRKLARPAIGVMMNVTPFLAWLSVFEEDECSDKLLIVGLFAYCTSFLFDGAGVVLGYLIGDFFGGKE